MTIVARLITPTAIPTRAQRPAKAGVQPLPFAPRRVAHRAVALVERAKTAFGVIDGRLVTFSGIISARSG